jgi:mannan polymerase II complex MNN10 subunit
MLTRSLRLSPSFLLIILVLALFVWQLNKEPGEERCLRNQVLPQDAIVEKEGPRIALMTFVTNQRSYLHLSLQNKDRKLCSLTKGALDAD